MWAFHRLYKNLWEITNNKQRVKGRTNMDLELQTQESEVDTLAFYVCSWLLREFCDSPTQLKKKMLTHLVIAFTAPCTGVDFLIDCFEVSLLTDYFGVSLLTDRRPSSFSSGLADFRGHGSLCGLRANIDKERPSGHSDAASKRLEIRSPLWPTMHEHTQRSTHIHQYRH